MGFLTRKGRYGGETYPSPPTGGGGGGATIAPLSRTYWVDGDSTVATQNGSIAAPYHSISAALAAIPVSADPDNTSILWVILVAASSYVENLSIPAYRNIAIVAAGSPGVVVAGFTVMGHVTWHNVAGTNAAPSSGFSSLLIQDISITGTITLTDDGGSPEELALVSTVQSTTSSGAIDGHTCTAFETLFLEGWLVVGGNIDMQPGAGELYLLNSAVNGNIGGAGAPLIVFMNGAEVTGNVTVTEVLSCEQLLTNLFGNTGTTVIEGNVTATGGEGTSIEATNTAFVGTLSAQSIAVTNGCTLLNNITCASLFVDDCSFSGSLAITVASGAPISVSRSAFSAVVTLDLSGGSIALFDAASWQSFVYAQGVQGTSTVLVAGGSLAAQVPGAALGNANATLTLNGSGASPGYTQGGNIYRLPPATASAPRTFQVDTGGGEHTGDVLTLVFAPQGGNNCTVNDNTGAAVFTTNGSNYGFVDLIFNGTNWVVQRASAT
jgi:hypothetical protein